jgi:hypothetical protein
MRIAPVKTMPPITVMARYDGASRWSKTLRMRSVRMRLVSQPDALSGE